MLNWGVHSLQIWSILHIADRVNANKTILSAYDNYIYLDSSRPLRVWGVPLSTAATDTRTVLVNFTASRWGLFSLSCCVLPGVLSALEQPADADMLIISECRFDGPEPIRGRDPVEKEKTFSSSTSSSSSVFLSSRFGVSSSLSLQSRPSPVFGNDVFSLWDFMNIFITL